MIHDVTSFRGTQYVLLTDDLEGHKLIWLRHLCNTYLSKENKLLVISLKKLEEEVTSEFLGRVSFRSDWPNRRTVIKIVNSISADAIVFTWDGDNWLLPFLSAKRPIQALLMRPYLGGSNLKSLASWFVKLLITHLENRIGYVSFASLSIPGDQKVSKLGQNVYDPNFDIIESAKSEILQFPKKQNAIFRILIPGFISERKNPLLAYQICEIVNQRNVCQVELFMVGRVSRDLLISLAQVQSPWLIVRNEFLNQSEYLKYIYESDLVLLPYENIGSSGTVIESLALETPVLLAYSKPWVHAAKVGRGNLILTKLNKDSMVEIIESVAGRSIHIKCDYQILKGELGAFDFLLRNTSVKEI